jgi:hypothetical protein
MKQLILIIGIYFISTMICSGDLKDDKIQRVSTGVFDLQKNTVSNFEFLVTNYGINFLNVSSHAGGGYWPRGSDNQYLYGSGVWFGAMKWIDADSLNGHDTVKYKKLRKLVEVSYNPNSGISWMVPGRISDMDLIDESDIKKYRTYFSTDMKESGEPHNSADGQNWPLWKSGTSNIDKLGFYVDVENRNKTTFPQGPAIYSDEDIFCTYKDTDLKFYEGGVAFRKKQGYPLRLQYEQTIYSWADEDKKDMIIMYYKIINTSKDTLQQCWFAPVFDVDLASFSNLIEGASNDHVSYYQEEPYLNMAYAWTNTDKGEAGKGFGYLGITMILSPVIGEKGRPDNSKLFDKNYIPIGLRTFKNWNIMDDLQEDVARYAFISLNEYDGDNGPGDKRMMMSSGPFEMYPGDTAIFAVQINFALPAKGGEVDGTEDDMVGLVRKVKSGKDYFINHMLTDILEGNNNQSDFEIYPNPASDMIYLSYQPTSFYSLIKIYDMLGNEVFSGNAISNGKYIQQNIDFLQTGTYIICIIDDKNVISKKLNVIK